mmetsp:Transcript_126751/g.354916  ORF Transcript_126751/g.354916 Transcript_126751/m.354916 type:complete len:360 (-) Transcript_126751:157-1236(-)
MQIVHAEAVAEFEVLPPRPSCTWDNAQHLVALHVPEGAWRRWLCCRDLGGRPIRGQSHQTACPTALADLDGLRAGRWPHDELDRAPFVVPWCEHPVELVERNAEDALVVRLGERIRHHVHDGVSARLRLPDVLQRPQAVLQKARGQVPQLVRRQEGRDLLLLRDRRPVHDLHHGRVAGSQLLPVLQSNRPSPSYRQPCAACAAHIFKEVLVRLGVEGYASMLAGQAGVLYAHRDLRTAGVSAEELAGLAVDVHEPACETSVDAPDEVVHRAGIEALHLQRVLQLLFPHQRRHLDMFGCNVRCRLHSCGLRHQSCDHRLRRRSLFRRRILVHHGPVIDEVRDLHLGVDAGAVDAGTTAGG